MTLDIGTLRLCSVMHAETVSRPALAMSSVIFLSWILFGGPDLADVSMSYLYLDCFPPPFSHLDHAYQVHAA